MFSLLLPLRSVSPTGWCEGTYYTSQPALLLSSAANIPPPPTLSTLPLSVRRTLLTVSVLLFSGTILLRRFFFCLPASHFIIPHKLKWPVKLKDFGFFQWWIYIRACWTCEIIPLRCKMKHFPWKPSVQHSISFINHCISCKVSQVSQTSSFHKMPTNSYRYDQCDFKKGVK